MTNIFWSAVLPQRPREGASEAYDNNLASFQPEIGESITRRRSTVKISTMQCSYVMNSNQVAIFRDFYHKSTSDGALSFYLPHPFDGESVKVKFKQPPDIGHISADFFDVRCVFQVIKT